VFYNPKCRYNTSGGVSVAVLKTLVPTPKKRLVDLGRFTFSSVNRLMAAGIFADPQALAPTVPMRLVKGVHAQVIKY